MPQLKVSRWFLLLLTAFSCKSAPQEHPDADLISFTLDQKPKNIVLMIGDGMGLSQVSAALYENNNRLALEKFPVIGFHKSYSYDNLITDSAAGATAFACGVKTYNGAIGLNADTIPCRTILEEAESYGLATGIVVTTTVTHATPAAFYAHQDLRIMFDQIAADMLKTEIDLVIGGGKRYFDNRELDNRNLYEELQSKGYNVNDYMQADINQIGFNAKKNMVFFTGDTDPPSASVGRDYLPYASKNGLRFLQNRSEKGFFLMIEGSQIDWACHNKQEEWAIDELLDFNKAIEEVIEFARKDGNTLVIVTGDHETGGMSINEGSRINKLKIAFTSNAHTGTLIPVYAYGPSAHLFSGIYENTDIYKKMRQAFGFSDSTSALHYRH
ncbi:MAG: alkaline phosphatase [Saprospiraceae bacterium]|nr:alkaline phosphatase [Saprospiraceae bacterium]